MNQHTGDTSNGARAPHWALVCGAVLVIAVVVTCAVFSVLFFQSPKAARQVSPVQG